MFGEVSVIRSWGRIGTCGRSMIVTYEIEDQVGAARSDLEALKRRRGHATG
ncbi:MAG: WGR domain-containing protein [Pseudomonadota bacterium]